MADDLGIAYDVLPRWRRKLAKEGKKPIPLKCNPRDEELFQV